MSDVVIESVPDLRSPILIVGFAGWANANQWDVKTLMQYVGWRDVQSALRYIDGADPFAAFRATTSTIGILDTGLEK